MYDYMRTLQKQFEPKPEFFQNLDGDIRQIHKQLSARLEPEDKKLLLKLIDMEDLLHSEARLHSFISGYRLACAIHMELAEDPMYAAGNWTSGGVTVNFESVDKPLDFIKKYAAEIGAEVIY